MNELESVRERAERGSVCERRGSVCEREREREREVGCEEEREKGGGRKEERVRTRQNVKKMMENDFFFVESLCARKIFLFCARGKKPSTAF